MKYIIRASLREEASTGWVWLDGYASRSIVKITNPKTDRSITCEVRKFDDNFLKHYNSSPRCHVSPELQQSVVVMSEWYRDALGGIGTTDADNTTGTVELKFVKQRNWFWPQLRVACNHPDIVVRLGTRLGVLGTWLGLIGLVPIIAELAICSSSLRSWVVAVILILAGVLAMFACRGPKSFWTAEKAT